MPGFNKYQRLRKPREFTQIVKSKPVVCNDRFFRVLSQKGSSGLRLGLAVSKKVDKRAVERNRIKRNIREVFRHWNVEVAEKLDQLEIDIFFQAKPAASGTCNQRLQAATYQHLITIQNKFKDFSHARNA